MTVRVATIFFWNSHRTLNWAYFNRDLCVYPRQILVIFFYWCLLPSKCGGSRLKAWMEPSPLVVVINLASSCTKNCLFLLLLVFCCGHIEPNGPKDLGLDLVKITKISFPFPASLMGRKMCHLEPLRLNNREFVLVFACVAINENDWPVYQLGWGTVSSGWFVCIRTWPAASTIDCDVRRLFFNKKF